MISVMSRLYVHKSDINGIGLFTKQLVKKGSHIAYIQGPIRVLKPTNGSYLYHPENWIGVGRYSWIDTDQSPFRYINHSCDPNVALVAKRKVIALKDIEPHTELTMDYSLTEAESEWELEECNCGADVCRGKIGTIDTLPRQTFNFYRNVIPKNFRKIYERKKHNDAPQH